jgi:diaminohydroxyphosphoribosylaminopyrimidine deaminase/5-amino-6-(5-phosphoribosylamino)uracil reductase
MEHALDLARKGVGLASPNPTVGCVIVKEGTILGEGFHQYGWKDHAEIVALKQAAERARGATLYVTLEPCNHTGFARLCAAGIEVESGLLEAEAQLLNETFSHWITTQKPFVTLKSALTLDGQLALPKPRKVKKHEWITSEESRAEVHRMRHASDALLTGIGTILADDPLLTDRSGLPRRRRLLRVILDTRLRLSPKSRIVQTSDDDLLVYTSALLKTPKARKLQNAGVELVEVKRSRSGLDLGAVLKDLGRRDILSVLLESGPHLNGAVLSAGLVNKLVLFYTPKIAGDSRVPFVNSGSKTMHPMRVRTIRQIGPDMVVEAVLRGPHSS